MKRNYKLQMKNKLGVSKGVFFIYFFALFWINI